MGDSDTSLPSVNVGRRLRSHSRSRSSRSEDETDKELAASKETNSRRLRSGRGIEKPTVYGRSKRGGKGGATVLSFTDYLKDTVASTAPGSAASADSESDLPSDVAPMDPSRLDAEQLRALAGHATATIMMVAKKSGHLQGPFIKRLKDAAASLGDVVSVLADRTEDSEARRLRLENTNLRREVENLKAELKAHRKEFAEMKAASARASKQAEKTSETERAGEVTIPVLQQILEDFKASMFSSLGFMMDAKIDGLQDRLLPARSIRPPLAADGRAEAPAPQRSEPRRKRGDPSVATGMTNERLASQENAPPMSAPTPRQQVPPPRRQEFPPLPTPQPSTSASAAVAPASVSVSQNAWSEVAKKPKKKKQVAPVAAPMPAQAAQPARKEVPVVRFQAPKTSVVVVTLRKEAEASGMTYQQALQKAEAEIDISDLGLKSGLRFKVTATGARMLEVPGTDGNDGTATADKLAERLEAALTGVAWVARPVKRGELRITELGDSATKHSVRAAVAKAGGIPEGQIKVLDIRPGPGRMGVTIVECPVVVANQLASAGRLMVGWGSAKVTALERRPLRCFKCMGLGHTRPTCPSDSDRGDRCCFRCGSREHRSLECTVEKPRCAVCSEAGLPAEHVMGGRGCNPPVTKGKDMGVARRTATSTTRGHSLTREGAEMSE